LERSAAAGAPAHVQLLHAAAADLRMASVRKEAAAGYILAWNPCYDMVNSITFIAVLFCDLLNPSF
jgi:hypothetical protein